MKKFYLNKIKLFENEISVGDNIQPKTIAAEFAETIKAFLETGELTISKEGNYQLPEKKEFHFTQKIVDEDKDVVICKSELVIEGFNYRKGYFLPFGLVKVKIEPTSSTREEIVIDKIHKIISEKIWGLDSPGFYVFKFKTSLEHQSEIKEYSENKSGYFWHEHYDVALSGNKIAEIISNLKTFSSKEEKEKIAALIKERTLSNQEILKNFKEIIEKNYSKMIEGSGNSKQIIISSLLNTVIEDIASIIVEMFKLTGYWIIDFVIELNHEI
jgi:hypothetical protein